MAVKRTLGLSALLVLASAALAGAAQTNYAMGQVAASELLIGLGARPVAMGEAFVGLADDLNCTAWNPAGLAQIKGHQVGFMHNIYLQDTSQEYLAYAQSVAPDAGVGANVTYFNYGSLDKVDDVGGFPQTVGSFTPTVLTAAVGYGQWFGEWVAAGGSLKLYSQHIDTESYSAVAVDLGALVRPGIEGLQLGIALQNLGTTIANASLPLNAKVGGVYQLPVKFEPQDTWRALLDVNLPFGDSEYTSVNVGTEYWVNQTFAARVGYVLKNTGDLGGVTGLTAGVGVQVAMFKVDYALLSFGDLGLTHQIALTVGF